MMYTDRNVYRNLASIYHVQSFTAFIVRLSHKISDTFDLRFISTFIVFSSFYSLTSSFAPEYLASFISSFAKRATPAILRQPFPLLETKYNVTGDDKWKIKTGTPI